MFSSNTSDNKNRRRSFFLFGGSQVVPKASTHKASTSNGSGKVLSSQTHRQQAVDISSSHNRKPSLHAVDGQRESKPVFKSQLSETGTAAHVNDILDDKDVPNGMHTDIAKRSTSHMKRPPPPPIDLEALNFVKQTPTLRVSSSGDIGQLSSTQETLKSASYSPSKTPVALDQEPEVKQHKRQISEAEKLVDDLDSYIKQQKEMSESAGNGSKGEDVPNQFTSGNSNFADDSFLSPKSSTSSKSSINAESPIESPFTYVGPLNLPVEDRNPLKNKEASLSKRRYDPFLDLDVDNDRFSFTTSLNDKSVKSIQHVALNDSMGAAPIITNYGYGYGAITDSDIDTNGSENDETSRLLGTGHDDDENLSLKREPSITVQETGNELEFSDRNTDDEEAVSRNFRVVNEDKPSFYLNGNDNNTTSTTNSTATEDYERPQDGQSKLSLPDASDNYGELSITSTASSYEPTPGMRETGADDIILETKNMVPLPDKSVSNDIEKPSGAPHVVDNLTTLSQSSRSSLTSSNNSSSVSPHPDKMVRLVSSYVEESRLKYYTTSNFLQAPPNLPISLKQKNNLIQPKNIKVRIRTSSKQIGIKHGGAKQKLLSLETTKEEENENASDQLLGSRNRITADHTKEFHNLLSKGVIRRQSNLFPNPQTFDTGSRGRTTNETNADKDSEYYLEDIPGDDAYDSDDAMAPLRENRGSQSSKRVSRSDTVVSYFTKNQRRLRSGTLENSYAYLQGLPKDVNIDDYRAASAPHTLERSDSKKSLASNILDPTYSNGNTLHVANPDTDSE